MSPMLWIMGVFRCAAALNGWAGDATVEKEVIGFSYCDSEV